MPVAPARTLDEVAARLEQVRALQSQVQQMEETRAVTSHPVLPALETLLPTGLHAGATYAVADSAVLALSLLAGASAQGSWCGVVGLPELGAEAAAGLGVDLARTIVVPDPGEHWSTVVGALVDVLPVVLLRPSARVVPGEASRLRARLRQRGSTLVVLGPWPHVEGRLEVGTAVWTGLGAGHGHLAGRQARVVLTPRGGRARVADLWLPGPDSAVREVAPGSATLPPVLPAPVPTLVGSTAVAS